METLKKTRIISMSLLLLFGCNNLAFLGLAPEENDDEQDMLLLLALAASGSPSSSSSGCPQMGGARQCALSSSGIVTTVAGLATNSGSTDGTGTAARFNAPYGITSDGTNLYVADSVNRTIRQVVIATGVVTTLAGLAGSAGSTDGTGSAARFQSPQGITTDGTNLYVSDLNHTIRQIVIATGVVTTLAGSAGSTGSTDGTGTAGAKSKRGLIAF